MSNELHNIAFISAIGIDPSKNGFHVSVQVLNPLAFSQQGANSMPFFVFEQEGHSLNNIMNKLSQKISRKMDVSHVQTIIVNEKIAKSHGIKKGISNMIRAPRYPYDAIVLITNNKSAKDFLEVLPFFELVTSREIASHLDNVSEERSSNLPVYLTTLQADILKKGKDAAVPTIQFKGNLDEAKSKSSQEKNNSSSKLIYFDGLQLFKNDKSVGWIDSNLSPTFYLLNNKMKKTNIRAACGKGKNISLDIIKSHTKIKVKMKKNQPTFTISTKLKGNIADFTCNLNLNELKNGLKMETLIEDKVKNNILKLIKTSQKNNSDIVGFGEIIEIQDHKSWRKIENDWKNVFPESQFDVQVDVTIQNYGEII